MSVPAPAVRPLTVLHVDPERGFGGGEHQVLGLVRHLAAVGERPLVAAHPGGALAAAAHAHAIPVVPLRIHNHADLLAGRRLARLLAREGCDMVHFHTARAHAMAAFLGRRGRVRRIVTRRMDYAPRGGWYTRWLYNQGVDAVVAISEGVRAVLLDEGVAPERVHVIASGVEPARWLVRDEVRSVARARWGCAPADVVLAVVGALEIRKGHIVLLDALALLADPRIRVLLAGRGAGAAALDAAVARLGLTARVRFLGQVEDVTAVLAAADVVVMPSLQEGLGVAALEAMAAGRPVIASRVGGLPEAIGEDAGILVPPGDSEALARAIARLAADPTLARAMGAAGARRVREHFTMEAMAAATRGLYHRLAQHDGVRP